MYCRRRPAPFHRAARCIPHHSSSKSSVPMNVVAALKELQPRQYVPGIAQTGWCKNVARILSFFSLLIPPLLSSHLFVLSAQLKGCSGQLPVLERARHRMLFRVLLNAREGRFGVLQRFAFCGYVPVPERGGGGGGARTRFRKKKGSIMGSHARVLGWYNIKHAFSARARRRAREVMHLASRHGFL